MFLAVFLAVACTSSVTETVVPMREAEVVVSEAPSPATQAQTPAPSPTEDPRPETPGAETPEQVMPTPKAVVATPAPTVSLEDPAPTKEPKEEVSYSPLIWVNDAAPSVDLQIFDADVIVVASLVSATAGVQQDGDVYRPGQILRFRSSEYLKGTGPTEFVVEVPIVEFEASTSAKALEIAQDYITRRNASYDQRPGILFLRGPLTAATIDEGQSDPSGTRSTAVSTTAFNFALERVSEQQARGSIPLIVLQESGCPRPAIHHHPLHGQRLRKTRTRNTSQMGRPYPLL